MHVASNMQVAIDNTKYPSIYVCDDNGPIQLEVVSKMYLNWRIHPGYRIKVANGGLWLTARVTSVHGYFIDLIKPWDSFHEVDLVYENGEVCRKIALRDGDENMLNVNHSWAWRVEDMFRYEEALTDWGLADLKDAVLHMLLF